MPTPRTGWLFGEQRGFLLLQGFVRSLSVISCNFLKATFLNLKILQNWCTKYESCHFILHAFKPGEKVRHDMDIPVEAKKDKMHNLHHNLLPSPMPFFNFILLFTILSRITQHNVFFHAHIGSPTFCVSDCYWQLFGSAEIYLDCVCSSAHSGQNTEPDLLSMEVSWWYKWYLHLMEQSCWYTLNLKWQL